MNRMTMRLLKRGLPTQRLGAAQMMLLQKMAKEHTQQRAAKHDCQSDQGNYNWANNLPAFPLFQVVQELLELLRVRQYPVSGIPQPVNLLVRQFERGGQGFEIVLF
jgi:hypothetical protein